MREITHLGVAGAPPPVSLLPLQDSTATNTGRRGHEARQPGQSLRARQTAFTDV